MNMSRVLDRRAGSIFAQIIKPRRTQHAHIHQTPRPASTQQWARGFRSQATKRQTIFPQYPKAQDVARRMFSITRPKRTSKPTPQLGSPEPAPSLSQRLKKLSREYGWTAVGVYLALSALDFPFCFLAVRALGTERIGQWEHNVVQWVKSIIAIPFPGLVKDTGESHAAGAETVEAAAREGSVAFDDELQKARDSKASKWLKRISMTPADHHEAIWTQLALAYAIHKSFIFIRVPLTAAILPKVVKTLRGWGYDIGKRKTKGK